MKDLLYKNLSTRNFSRLHNLQDHQVQQAFEHACMWNYVDMVKFLAENYHIKLFDPNYFLAACRSHHLDLVQYLLTSPYLPHPDIHIKDDLAFMIACEENYIELAHFLLSSPHLSDHADIHTQHNGGLRQACKHNNVDMVRYLLTSPQLLLPDNNGKVVGHANIYDVHPYRGSIFMDSLFNAEVTQYLLWDYRINITPDIVSFIIAYPKSDLALNVFERQRQDDILAFHDHLHASIEPCISSNIKKNKL